VLNFKIKHGEAVIAGIISALYLSNLLGFISSEKLNEFLQLPLKIKLPSKISSLDKNKLYEIMLSDKKNRENKIKFVLLQDIGKILIDVEATKKEVNTALDKMFEKI
jgi:3-dehydroquinate synthetase